MNDVIMNDSVDRKYGTLTIAKEYQEKNKIEEWLQLFLRNDGDNRALADGLLLEPRYYIGLRYIPIELLSHIREGAPEYLEDPDDIEYFFYVVDKMKESYGKWDTPPLIIEYREGTLWVNDGRHRLIMYRDLEIGLIPAVLWTTGEVDRNHLEKLLAQVKRA